MRPDRQCMLFSATFKRKIERLARDALVDPVKIVQGSVGEASEDVTQIVRVMGLGGYKGSMTIFLNLLPRTCTLSFLKILLNQ